jgi:hypothetical protein
MLALTSCCIKPEWQSHKPLGRVRAVHSRQTSCTLVEPSVLELTVVDGRSDVQSSAFVSVLQQKKDVAPLCKHENTAAGALLQVAGSIIRCVEVGASFSASVKVASVFVGDIAAIRSASNNGTMFVPSDSSNCQK